MELKSYYKKARNKKKGEILQASYRFLVRQIKIYQKRKRDRKVLTYLADDLAMPARLINYSLPLAVKDFPTDNIYCELADLYVEHFFDLLGSGWVQVRPDMDCLGLDNHKYKSAPVNISLQNSCNRKYQKKLEDLLNKDYLPIDWQLDFKSGYRWSENTWYMDIKYGNLSGVDVKVPWELARMQHLPVLAYAYILEKSAKRERYKVEFCQEILDFIAHNPPRYGVNWRCTMDVGIRVSNWLIAYDIFCGQNEKFSSDFEEIFAQSVYAHAMHIVDNLEYSPKLRSNHYLSDIAGLLFASMHLSSTPQTDCWLAFALQELVSEMKNEFHVDGSNFEGSTSYHRLSTEIILYATLFACQLSEERRKSIQNCDITLHTVKPKLLPYQEQDFDLTRAELFPNWYWERLQRALQFTVDLLKCDGRIEQIGDNDSGRFFKLAPCYEVLTVNEAKSRYVNLKDYLSVPNDVFYDEDILNHTHLKNVLAVLREDKFVNTPETKIIRILMVKCGKPINHISPIEINNKPYDGEEWKHLPHLQYVFSSHDEKDLLAGIEIKAYLGMGLYIFKGDNLYMLVRCGEVGQNGNGGHSHNDQLSMTLNIAGRDIISDPGTYLYTPLLEKRNLFRSTRAHFTPQDSIGREQNSWLNAFSMYPERTHATVLSLSKTSIFMRHLGFGYPVYRKITIKRNFVIVDDYGENISKNNSLPIVSNGYGKILNDVKAL